MAVASSAMAAVTVAGSPNLKNGSKRQISKSHDWVTFDTPEVTVLALEDQFGMAFACASPVNLYTLC